METRIEAAQRINELNKIAMKTDEKFDVSDYIEEQIQIETS